MPNNIRDLFFNDNILIDLSDKALSAFRMQNYYKGLMLFKQLIDIMMNTAPIILSSYDYFNEYTDTVNEEQLNHILGGLLEAHEAMDYVLLADNIEQRFLPFLLMLQEIIIRKEGILYSKDLFDRNINALLKKDALLGNQFQKDGPLLPETEVQGYMLETTSCGLCTLALYDNNKKFYLHSNGQVMREARVITTEWFVPDKAIYHIYGMGLGYHIHELAEMDETIEINVYESDWKILRYAFTYTDLENLICSGRIHIHYDPEFIGLNCALKKIEEDAVFAIHYPSVRNIKDNKMRLQLEDFFISYSSIKNQIIQLNSNFKKNIQNYDASVDCLRESFCEKNLIIVAAGPSLDKNFRELKKVPHNTIIMAVGTVFKKLIKEGIQPDYVIISDATAAIYQQFDGLEHLAIPLLFLSTAYYRIPQCYGGRRYLICQQDFTKAEKYAANMGYQLYQSGGSVSTIALDIGIQFHCNSISFIGLDLAYTNNHDHAADTTPIIEFNPEDLRKVEDIHGAMVSTGKNLDIYRKWIEQRIEGVKEIEFVNATEGGALIKGMQNKKISEWLDEED